MYSESIRGRGRTSQGTLPAVRGTVPLAGTYLRGHGRYPRDRPGLSEYSNTAKAFRDPENASIRSTTRARTALLAGCFASWFHLSRRHQVLDKTCLVLLSSAVR